jgi:glycosyltransferase involved in cell wall biosynthesis
MIKVLFTSLTGFPKLETGGPNKVIYLLMQNLPVEKFESKFASKHGIVSAQKLNDRRLNQKFDLIRESLFKNFKIYRDIFTSSLYLKYFFQNALKDVTKYIQQVEFDILNAHDIRTIYHFPVQTNKKVILSIHSGSIVNDMKSLYGIKKGLQKLYEEFREKEIQTIKKVDLLVFPSVAARRLYFDDLGMNESLFSTKIIYNGIDLEKISSTKVDKKFRAKFNFLFNHKLKILSVANHIPSKNLDKILTVLAEVKKIKDDFLFINVGSGPLTPLLKMQVKTLNLEKNVLFIPFLSNDEVIKLMKTCDIYISLSERVVFDLVVLETLACGMKVIASNIGGNVEAISDGYNGYLVDINDKEKIVEVIMRDDYNIRENARISSFNFSISKMVEEYIKVYEE